MADDFTGANDIGIRLRVYGLSVISSLYCEEYPADVTIIDTGTRNIEKEFAYEKVKKTFIRMKEIGFDKFYKKIDSTFRGNIKAELNAISENIDNGEQLYIVGAFPDMGRIIVNGKIFVRNILLHESEFSRDPVHPMSESDLTVITGAELINLSEVRGDIDKAILDVKSKLVCFDTETETDLQIIAEALVRNKKDKYIVGAAGIMRYLPKIWRIIRNKVLIFSGSCNENNIEQLDYFREENNGQFQIYDLDVTRLDTLPEIVENDKDIIIRTITDKSEMYNGERYYLNKGISRNDMSKYISERTAHFAYNIIKKFDIRKIIVAGGETSAQLLKTMDIRAVNISSEIQTGVPLLYTLGMKYALITKPGGFGDKNIFFRCYEKLKSAENIVRQ